MDRSQLHDAIPAPAPAADSHDGVQQHSQQGLRGWRKTKKKRRVMKLAHSDLKGKFKFQRRQRIDTTKVTGRP